MHTPRSSHPPGLGPLGVLAAVVLAALCCVPRTVSAGQVPAPAEAITPLGFLEPFWRNSPALGPYHEVGHGLHVIPQHALTGDFAYPRRPFPKEVPFADHLTLVRILGGFNDGSDNGEGDPAVRARDLAYRDPDGNIQTRFELLEPRLRPYLENGYTRFTVVLDNVPWAFPEIPVAYGLGQHAPPAGMGEWRDFVAAFCRELHALLPPEAIQSLRFRVGTEMNDKRRFSGNQDQFERFYAASVAGIRETFPDAEIGFFNIAGASVFAIEERHNVNAFELVRDNLREPNPFTGQPTPAIDFIALSRYFSMGTDLSRNAAGARAVWEEFERRFPELKGVSREIHEFGVAPFGEGQGKDPFVSQESGPRGAAATALMIGLLREAGIDALWHWSQGELVDRFRDSNRRLRHLFTGVSWLYQVLEYMRDGQGFLLRPLNATDNSTRHLGLLSRQPERCLLLLLALPQGQETYPSQTISFPIPEGSFAESGPRDLRMFRFNQDTSAHRRIRDDLARAGLLEQRFLDRPDRLGLVREMARNSQGERLVGDRFDTYAQIYAQSLTLRKPPAADGPAFQHHGTHHTININLQAPEVIVIEWKR